MVKRLLRDQSSDGNVPMERRKYDSCWRVIVMMNPCERRAASRGRRRLHDDRTSARARPWMDAMRYYKEIGGHQDHIYEKTKEQ